MGASLFVAAFRMFSCGMWGLVPRPEMEPRGPLHWECGVLATGPPGQSLPSLSDSSKKQRISEVGSTRVHPCLGHLRGGGIWPSVSVSSSDGEIPEGNRQEGSATQHLVNAVWGLAVGAPSPWPAVNWGGCAPFVAQHEERRPMGGFPIPEPLPWECAPSC